MDSERNQNKQMEQKRKEYMRNYMKIYYPENKDKFIKQYTRERYEKNRDTVISAYKRYYLKNYDEINDKRKIKYREKQEIMKLMRIDDDIFRYEIGVTGIK